MSNLSKMLGIGVVEYFEDIKKMRDDIEHLSKKHDVSIKIILEDLEDSN